jgi:hypothetical protein
MLGLCRLVTVAAAVIALTVCGGAASSAAGSPRWAIVASGNSVPSLLAVSALADNQVWAVGSTRHGNAARPAVAFWDGSSLQVVNLLGSASRGWLEGVSALSSDDVWAVGSTTPGAASKSRSLVTHWDGQHWNLMRLPVLPAASDLRDVKAFASDDVWAVGNAGADRALVLHFDGHAWRRVDTSNVAPAGTSLSAIDGRSPTDIWAVGGSNLNGTTFGWSDLILHWDGRQWSSIPSHFDDSTGITAYSLDATPWGAVWTLHTDGSGTPIQKIVRWNGWRQRPVTVYFLTPPLDQFEAIAARARNDVWVVGWRCRSDTNCQPLVMHWSGRTWQVRHTALERVPSGGLNGLSILPSGQLWAAGDRLLARYG